MGDKILNLVAISLSRDAQKIGHLNLHPWYFGVSKYDAI